ncbi:zinc ribbon domain-containing protein [Vulcanisaeta souniana]|uniref:zinc ribbon domain-containing protein n=1 Tax=Vulcanisaeta souniana TaxID=164452 RepID=UPI0006D2A01E|nr:zinc ribbon domain-containing protein [Vulcanisaeta souniana]
MRDSINKKDGGVRWKLTLFAYRRLQHAVIAKAVEYNVPVVFVDPRDTSNVCPMCGGARLNYIHRLAYCLRCGFIGDRDVVGATNIWLRALHAYVGGARVTPPKRPPQ